MSLEIPTGFEWDPNKAAKNLEKHGIAFEDAVRIFDEATYETPDFRYGEPRVVATGVLESLEITVVYTVRDTRYRIISARRARESEREAYHRVCP